MQREIKFFDPSIVRKKKLTDQNYQENQVKNHANLEKGRQ